MPLTNGNMRYHSHNIQRDIMDSRTKNITTLEFKSKNKDGSIKEHFKIIKDGTNEVVINCQQ